MAARAQRIPISCLVPSHFLWASGPRVNQRRARSLASKHICFVSRPVVLPHILSVVIDTAEKYRANAVVSEVFRSS